MHVTGQMALEWEKLKRHIDVNALFSSKSSVLKLLAYCLFTSGKYALLELLAVKNYSLRLLLYLVASCIDKRGRSVSTGTRSGAVRGVAPSRSTREKQTCTQATLTLNSSTATDSVLTNDAQTGMCCHLALTRRLL